MKMCMSMCNKQDVHASVDKQDAHFNANKHDVMSVYINTQCVYTSVNKHHGNQDVYDNANIHVYGNLNSQDVYGNVNKLDN